MSDTTTYNRKAGTQSAAQPAPDAPPPEAIRVDGFAQIVAMLQVADDDFRDSLLRRIASRDPNLADNLRRTLRAR